MNYNEWVSKQHLVLMYDCVACGLFFIRGYYIGDPDTGYKDECPNCRNMYGKFVVMHSPLGVAFIFDEKDGM